MCLYSALYPVDYSFFRFDSAHARARKGDTARAIARVPSCVSLSGFDWIFLARADGMKAKFFFVATEVAKKWMIKRVMNSSLSMVFSSNFYCVV